MVLLEGYLLMSGFGAHGRHLVQRRNSGPECPIRQGGFTDQDTQGFTLPEPPGDATGPDLPPASVEAYREGSRPVELSHPDWDEERRV